MYEAGFVDPDRYAAPPDPQFHWIAKRGVAQNVHGGTRGQTQFEHPFSEKTAPVKRVDNHVVMFPAHGKRHAW